MISPRLALVLFVLPTTAIAQNIPVTNWTVPPYRAASASGGLAPMVDISPGVAFTAMQPCRVVDTRNPAGPYGGPALATNVSRSFDINSGPCTSIPAAAEAYSLSIGAILPPADGFLSAWPTGNVQPLISQLNFVAGEVIANAAIVPAGTSGSINVLVNIGPTNVYIDINGYFTGLQNAGQFFQASGSREGPVLYVSNSAGSDATTGVEGIRAELTAVNPGSGAAAVRGHVPSTLLFGTGVWGSHGGDGTGVRGRSESGVGVEGSSAMGYGFYGFTNNAARAGMRGDGPSAGVIGLATTNDLDAAGILGIANLSPSTTGANFSHAGVRGQSKTGGGTVGISEATGAAGFLMNPANGTLLAEGRLGANFGGVWGVHAVGNIGATGMKPFLEPHPVDPSLVIQYIALEGPEAGTYFRGRARFQRGVATIAVPEDFRMVTDPEGLTVQITPIGEMASFAVVRMGLDRIVVKASRDVEFSYLVHGVRASFKDVGPFVRDTTFVPRSADARVPTALAERQKRVLIENGTYNDDGSVRMETARRLGWDKLWETRKDSPGAQPED